MKIFISWSESRSKVIAEALRDWLPDVIQACEPWLSSEDIDPGSRWSFDLAKQLDETRFGIFCLTPENLNAPWILFEAGAVSKKLDDKTKVCPYLFGIEPTDITGPLTQFQAVKADKADTKKLMQAINRTLGSEALSDERFNRAFESNWKYLDEILKKVPEGITPVKQPARNEKNMIEEILITVREHSRILSNRSSDVPYHQYPMGLSGRIVSPWPWAEDNVNSNVRFEIYLPTIDALMPVEGGSTAEEVSKRTGRSRNLESEYLNILYKAGLLRRIKSGKKIKYVPEDEKINWVFGLK